MYIKENVKGYEEYQVDTNGIVYSKKGKPLKYSINHNGYSIINFYVNHQRKGFGVHTIVANQFLYKPKNDNYQVNHKDGNKQNNNVNNLEWVTPLENTDHAKNILGYNNSGENNYNSRKIRMIGNGNSIIFGSIADASRKMVSDGIVKKFNSGKIGIWRALNGIRKTYKGYIWKYI